MKIFLLFIIVGISVLIEGADREVRGEKEAEKCTEGTCDKSEPKSCIPCKNECKCLPKVQQIGFSAITETTVTCDKVLVCTPGSYFKRLEYHGSFPHNVTCNGVTTKKLNYVPGIYTAIKDTANGEVSVPLDAGPLDIVSSFNNGRVGLYRRAKLANDECRGQVLTTYSAWVPDDPFNGCCTSGVRRVDCVYIKVTIKAKGDGQQKCCSECYLLDASCYYSHSTTN